MDKKKNRKKEVMRYFPLIYTDEDFRQISANIISPVYLKKNLLQFSGNKIKRV